MESERSNKFQISPDGKGNWKRAADWGTAGLEDCRAEAVEHREFKGLGHRDTLSGFKGIGLMQVPRFGLGGRADSRRVTSQVSPGSWRASWGGVGEDLHGAQADQANPASAISLFSSF